jgi:methylamine dehydrogenase accessory protein MauD
MNNLLWSYLALWLLVIILALTTAALARQIALLYGRLPEIGARLGNAGPDIGEVLDPIFETNLVGALLEVDALTLDTLFVFIAPGCSLCEQLLPAVGSLAKRERARFEVIVVSISGDETVNRAYAQRFDIALASYIVSSALASRLAVSVTPYGLLIDKDRRVVTKGLTNNREQLESLLNVIRHHEQEARDQIGSLSAAAPSSH